MEKGNIGLPILLQYNFWFEEECTNKILWSSIIYVTYYNCLYKQTSDKSSVLHQKVNLNLNLTENKQTDLCGPNMKLFKLVYRRLELSAQYVWTIWWKRVGGPNYIYTATAQQQGRILSKSIIYNGYNIVVTSHKHSNIRFPNKLKIIEIHFLV